ncbi:hypothetical protein L596_012304 [Steinernema carpocapsae]|uniref:Uncharacterized protein n=1 Tax=Steinernema carpocapsae TaxID=34508 RepID=A0A4U5NXG3_STECR|nr:hypothetical protein L596_012304 [Steinernema carpocapsae]
MGRPVFLSVLQFNVGHKMGRSPRRSHSRSRSRDRSDRRRSRRSRSRDRDRESRRSRSGSRSPRRKTRRRSSSASDHDRGKDVTRELWRAVERDRTDFKSWMALLNAVEQTNDIRSARDAYKIFFEHYPFCYGYWRKYAEMERRNDNFSRTLDIYERGVEAISVSSELWISYAAFLRAHFNEGPNDVKKIRNVYERAIEACGRDFRSDKLWEEFIGWEMANGELGNVMELYDELIATPTFSVAQNVERFRQFVTTSSPRDILRSKEFDEISDRLENNMAEIVVFDEERKLTPEGLQQFQNAIFEARAAKIERNQRRIQERWGYESAIKRPYFHVTALEAQELKVWDQYLDFEMSTRRLPHKAVDVLFERCVVSCALYDYFWTKYANYLIAYDPENTSKIRSVYKRAVIHVPRQADVHLAYSAFEEQQGSIGSASEILHKFNNRNPGFLAIESRLMTIEYRQAKKAAKDKEPDYSDLIQRYEKLVHNAQAPREVCSYYAMRLAMFHAKVRNDPKLAGKVLNDAISYDRRNYRLYKHLIDVAFAYQPLNESAVLGALEQAINSNDLTYEHRLQFSSRRMEFLDEYGTDMKDYHKYLGTHLRLQQKVKTGRNQQPDHNQLQSGFFSHNGNGHPTQAAPSAPSSIPVLNSSTSTVITLADPSA